MSERSIRRQHKRLQRDAEHAKAKGSAQQYREARKKLLLFQSQHYGVLRP